MAENQIELPEGFVLDSPDIEGLPEGFTLDKSAYKPSASTLIPLTEQVRQAAETKKAAEQAFMPAKEDLSVSFDMPIPFEELNKIGSMPLGIDNKRLIKAATDSKTISKITGMNIPLSFTYENGDKIDEWLAKSNNQVQIEKPLATWGEIAATKPAMAVGRIMEATGGTIRTIEDFLASGVTPEMRAIIEENKDLLEGYEGPLPFKPTEYGKRLAGWAEERMKAIEPNIAPDSLKFYASSIADVVVDNMPLLLIAAGTGQPELALNYFLLSAQGRKYQQLREQGISPDEARGLSAIVGVSEKYTEKMYLKKLLDTSIPFAKRLLLASGLEVFGEDINTVVESAADKVSITPDMTIDDVAKALVRTTIITLGASGLMTTAIHPLVVARGQAEKIATDKGKGDEIKKWADDFKKEKEEQIAKEEITKKEAEITPPITEEAAKPEPITEPAIVTEEAISEDKEFEEVLDMIAEGEEFEDIKEKAAIAEPAAKEIMGEKPALPDLQKDKFIGRVEKEIEPTKGGEIYYHGTSANIETLLNEGIKSDKTRTGAISATDNPEIAKRFGDLVKIRIPENAQNRILDLTQGKVEADLVRKGFPVGKWYNPDIQETDARLQTLVGFEDLSQAQKKWLADKGYIGIKIPTLEAGAKGNEIRFVAEIPKEYISKLSTKEGVIPDLQKEAQKAVAEGKTVEEFVKGQVTHEVSKSGGVLKYKDGKLKYSIDDGKFIIDNVDVKTQKSGIGTTLMNDAELVARDRGFNSIELNAYPQNATIKSNDLIKFYENLGYEVNATAEILGEISADMSKSISRTGQSPKTKSDLTKAFEEAKGKTVEDYRIMSLKTPEKLELKTIADVKKVFENDKLTLDGKKYSDIKERYKPETFDNFTKVRQTKDKVIIEGKKIWINDADGGRFETPTITFEKIPTEIPMTKEGIEFLGAGKVFGMEEARKVLKNLSKADTAFAENPTFTLKNGKFNFTIDKREYNIIPKALSVRIEDMVNIGEIKEGQTLRLSKGYLEGKEPELFLIKKGITPPPTLSFLGTQEIYEALEGFIKSGKIQEGMGHLTELGKTVYGEGKTTLQDFVKGMKGYLGELYEKVKYLINQVYQSVKAFNEALGERGAIGGKLSREQMSELRKLGYYFGQMSKMTSEQADKVIASQKRIRKFTGILNPYIKMIREDEALNAAWKKAEQNARIAFRAGNKEGAVKEKAKMKEILARAREKLQIKQALKKLKNTSEKLSESKVVSADYRKKIKTLIGQYELTGHTEKTIEELKAKWRSLQRYLDRAKEAGEDIEIPQKVLDKLSIITRIPKDKLTLSQINGLQQEIDLLGKLGKTKWASKEAIYEAEQNDRKQRLLETAAPINSKELSKQPIGSDPRKWSEAYIKLRNYLQKSRLGLRSIDALAEITGMTPMKDDLSLGFGNYLVYNDEAFTQWHELTKDFTDGIFDRIGAKLIEKREGGVQRLGNSGYIQADLDKIKLTPQEEKAMVLFRELIEKPYSQVKKFMLDNYNIALPDVDNYVSFHSDYDAMNELELQDKYGNRPDEAIYKKKTVEMGFTKATAELSKIKLELNADKILRRHLDDVAYMLTMGRDIRQYFEIVNSPEMKAKLGDTGSLAWLQWLDLMARKGGVEGAKRMAALDFVRRNLGAATLSFRLSSALVQFTSFTDTMATIGAEWTAKGAASITKKEWRNFIMDNFPEIKKAVGDDIAFRDFDNTFFPKTIKLGFTPLRVFDGIMRSTAAAGAYQKLAAERGIEIDLTKPDKNLIQEATRLMRNSQGSSFFLDQPLAITAGFGITDNRSFNKALLQFQSFMLNRWDNINRQIWSEGIKKGNYTKASMSFFWMVIVAAAMEEVLRRTARGVMGAISGDDDKEDEPFDESMLQNILQNVPVLGQIVSALTYSSNPVPIINAFEKVLSGLGGLIYGKTAETQERGAVRAIGAGAAIGLGVPLTASQIIEKSLKE